MTARFCSILVLASASLLPAANVEQRLNRLENQVSEMQLLLEQLSRKPLLPGPRIIPPSSQPNQYHIRKGDSYWSISRRHGVSVAALEKANPGIHPRRLTIGKAITIPGNGGSPTPSFSATAIHRVKKGEIMGRIAKSHGITLQQLMNANRGVDPKRLRIGSTLTIPGQQQSPPKPAPQVETKSGLPEKTAPERVPDSSPSRGNPYLKALESAPPVVEAHNPRAPSPALSEPKLITLNEDTRFSKIASEHKTTVTLLNKLNRRELDPDQMIKAGSQLYIPGQ